MTCDSTDIRVSNVELHQNDNRTAHHTQDYEDQSLIVRRGQEFKVTITFSRPLDLTADKVILQFTAGRMI